MAIALKKPERVLIDLDGTLVDSFAELKNVIKTMRPLHQSMAREK